VTSHVIPVTSRASGCYPGESRMIPVTSRMIPVTSRMIPVTSRYGCVGCHRDVTGMSRLSHNSTVYNIQLMTSRDILTASRTNRKMQGAGRLFTEMASRCIPVRPGTSQ